MQRSRWTRWAVGITLLAVGLGSTMDVRSVPSRAESSAEHRVDPTGPNRAVPSASASNAPDERAASPIRPTLYVVGTAHLDTQWLWTIQDTIRDYIPSTLRDNFARFDANPDYVFSFEGAFRYMLAKEYDPAGYARLKDAVAKGRWRVAGSGVDAGDVNIPAPESLIRHVLYGNGFFRRELGRTSADIYLPDCFGFGFALPTVAAHCGLRGFSTQKLTWGSSVGIPFDIGLWEGVDGSKVIAALNPGDYVSTIREDLSESKVWRERAEALRRSAGPPIAYRYFGVGDQGGAPDAESVGWLEKSIAGKGPLRVLSTGSDQLARDLTPAEAARLPRYRGELLMKTHGTGCYTSQAAMKRWNRKNEQLAAAAERASVVADWLGGAPYPREALRDAWVRFLWHHHHDDVTGTSTPLAYPFSWNDEILSMKAFAGALETAAGVVARALDTRPSPDPRSGQPRPASEGRFPPTNAAVPIVVFNPLPVEREDVVETVVRFDGGPPPRAVRVYGPDGVEVPSQIAGADKRAAGGADESAGGSSDAEVRVLFLAKAPSIGFAVYHVRRADGPFPPLSMTTGVRVTERELENARYRVRLNQAGDIASVLDKKARKELLSAPAGLDLFTVAPGPWPEWEISWKDLAGPPRERVQGPATVRVVERGPVRVAIDVSRAAGGSLVTQRIRLAAGGAGETVEVDTSLDWRTPATLVKATFPLSVANRRATYDLGIGTIERANDTEKLYEVPAQQWADITSVDGRYGVAVLEDSKYGWDKPENGVLRLSLVHSPPGIEKDFGRHRFVYAIAGHEGDWREGHVPALAARLNQPLVAFQAAPHGGRLGRRFSMLRTSAPEQVEVGALKMAEESDEVIVRLVEKHGRPAPDVTLTMANPIVAVREVTGAERPLSESLALDLTQGGAPRIVGGKLRFAMAPYRPRTFALRLAPSRARVAPSVSAPVRLDYDTDVASPHDAPGDGDFDAAGHALPAEQLPATLVSDGIRFTLGPTTPGAANAVTCRGQTIEIDPQFDARRLDPRAARRVEVLAAARGRDRRAVFRIDGREEARTIHSFTGYVGQSQSLVVDGRIVPAEAMDEPFIRESPVAWVGTHRHTRGEGARDGFGRDPETQDLTPAGKEVTPAGKEVTKKDRPSDVRGSEPYVFCYLFRYSFGIDDVEGAGSEGSSTRTGGRPSSSRAARSAPRGPIRLTLPDDEEIRVLAVTLVSTPDGQGETVSASRIVDSISGTRIRPRGGLSIDAVRVSLSCDRPGAAIHYTIDGAEPTLDDPPYQGPFTIDRDATVRARAFFGRAPDDDVAVRRFRFAPPRAAVSPGRSSLARSSPGLFYECFEGAWKDLSGIGASPPVRTGISPVITADLRTKDADFGLRFSGFVDVPRDGVYTFTTRSDDGSALRVAGLLVVDNDGLHGARERSGQVALAAGLHPIEVLFFQRGGDIVLDVAWEGPEVPRQAIPSSALSHAEAEPGR